MSASPHLVSCLLSGGGTSTGDGLLLVRLLGALPDLKVQVVAGLKRREKQALKECNLIVISFLDCSISSSI